MEALSQELPLAPEPFKLKHVIRKLVHLGQRHLQAVPGAHGVRVLNYVEEVLELGLTIVGTLNLKAVTHNLAQAGVPRTVAHLSVDKLMDVEEAARLRTMV